MPSSNVCWGIEIGSYAIKALRLELGGESLRVADFAVIPHKKVLSTPGVDATEVLRVGLGELVSQFEFAGAGVAMSVPGHSAFARFAKLPPVEPKKIPDIVKFEAVQQIPFPIDQVEWDYQTFHSPDSPDVEVGIFAITRERIMERLGAYEEVGIIPDSVTLSPVAAYNALAYDLAFTEKTPGTIILDIGTTSTDLVIAEAGRVWIRTFPIGGHHFTEALVNSFQLSYPKAEKFKREAESSKHARHIFQAMRPIFSDLAQDVQRSIGYYQSLHKDAKLERLIGLGSTFRLPGLRKYLKQQLQLDVYRMEQFKRIGVDGPRAGEFQAMALNMGTAYGLALQGLGLATLEANLMPVAVLREAMWKRKARWFGAAAAIAVAAGGAMFIRPFLDDQSVSANPPDRIISDTIHAAQAAKSDAAEVTGGGGPNAAAANVLALLEMRDIIPRIEADMRQMVLAAEAKKPDPNQPAFTLRQFSTDYIPPVAGAAGAEGAPPPDPANPGAGTTGRVRVVAQFTTTHESAVTFANETLDRWLRSNAKRDGVPYEIVIERNPVRVVRGSVAGQPGPQFGAGPSPRGPAQMPPPASGRGTGRGIAPPTLVGGEQPPRRVQAGGPGGEEAYTPPPTGADPRNAQAHQDLAQLAPLSPPPPPQSGPQSIVTVTWDAVLLPKPAPAGGAS
ncbi:MAG: type IV pilus assembly protein PilM [Phycisphaerales bacterium]